MLVAGPESGWICCCRRLFCFGRDVFHFWMRVSVTREKKCLFIFGWGKCIMWGCYRHRFNQTGADASFEINESESGSLMSYTTITRVHFALRRAINKNDVCVIHVVSLGIINGSQIFF